MPQTVNASTVDETGQRVFTSEVVTSGNVRVAFEFRDPNPLNRSVSIDVDWDNDGRVDLHYATAELLEGSNGDFLKSIISDGVFTEIEAQQLIRFAQSGGRQR